jgi:hypothetical protein
MGRELPDRTYTAAEVDAAIEALQEPRRRRHARGVVTHVASARQRVSGQALREGGWLGAAHELQKKSDRED